MNITAFAQRFLDYQAGPDGSAPLVTPEESVKNFRNIRSMISFSQRVMLRTFIDNGCDYDALDDSEVNIEIESK